MCGICGIISKTPITNVEVSQVNRVNAALRHRGPDGRGEHISHHVLLAMRRLAIIDLEGGWQPLWNEDKSIALVANGEVYNFVELQRDLEARGHRYRTHSDCESIIHAYEEFGEDFVHKLRGMYAFALYDINKRRVILGRDRMGEKPLYLHEKDGVVWFSSELRSLLSGGVVPFKLDAGAINLFFHYTYVPEPRTAIEGVRKLPAGHLLTIDLEPWRVRERSYWRLEDAPPIEGDSRSIIRAELETIAKLVTRSDVPVGVALSAGIDSSAVAALVSRAAPGKIHALTVGYPGRPRQDERAPAKRWAQELGMPFHEIEVPVREVVELFPERAFWRDDPIADPAGHSYFAVSRLAHEQGIPVLLQGQGGDELFWGYPWAQTAARLCRLKAAGSNGSGHLWKRIRNAIPPGVSKAAVRTWVQRNLGWFYGYEPMNPDSGQPKNRLVGYNLTLEYQRGAFAVPRLFSKEFMARASQADPGEPFTLPLPWEDIGVALTAMQCRTYLLENGMMQGDRLSMINSVELRLPLSDYRLAEIAVGLRKASPDDALPPKQRLREAIEDLVPEYILNRPKSGFTPPSRLWTPALVDAYRHSLEGGYLAGQGVLTPEAVTLLQGDHPRFSPWTDIFYRTLVLEFWCRGMEAITGGTRQRVQRIPAIA